MKIEKTASDSQKITMSKDEWSLIGKQAGWDDGNQEGGGFEEPGENIEPQDDISPEITRKMLKNRLDIAEAALWIMADKVLEEDFVFDENMTPTDLVMECRRLAITKGKG